MWCLIYHVSSLVEWIGLNSRDAKYFFQFSESTSIRPFHQVAKLSLQNLQCWVSEFLQNWVTPLSFPASGLLPSVLKFRWTALSSIKQVNWWQLNMSRNSIWNVSLEIEINILQISRSSSVPDNRFLGAWGLLIKLEFLKQFFFKSITLRGETNQNKNYNSLKSIDISEPNMIGTQKIYHPNLNNRNFLTGQRCDFRYITSVHWVALNYQDEPASDTLLSRT